MGLSREDAVSWLWALIVVIAGAAATLVSKQQFSIRSYGTETCYDVDGEPTKFCPFDKPWFAVLEMKFAMALCLPYLAARHALTPETKRNYAKGFVETPMMPRGRGGAAARGPIPKRRAGEFSPLLARATLNTSISAIERGRARSLSGDASLRRAAATDEFAASLRAVAAGAPATGSGPRTATWRSMVAAALLPAALDLVQTVVANVGLLWVDASVYQMARGSQVVFSALLTAKWLGRPIKRYEGASVALICVALVLVGAAGLAGGGGGGSSGAAPSSGGYRRKLAGLGLVTAGQAIGAVQNVVEERLLTRGARGLTPVVLTGLEGLWGLALFLPLAPLLTLSPTAGGAADAIWHEDFLDTVAKVADATRRSRLRAAIAAYVVCVGLLNVGGNHVTKRLSAVVRSILENLRTVGVWAAELALYRYYGGSAGEAWTTYSYLEAAGFTVLFLATLTYKGLLKLPCAGIYDAADTRPPRPPAPPSPYMASVRR